MTMGEKLNPGFVLIGFCVTLYSGSYSFNQLFHTEVNLYNVFKDALINWY